MASVRLSHSTGDSTIDARLRDAIGRFERDLPGVACSYYLFGSHVDGSTTDTSDVDLCIVLNRDPGSDARERAERVGRAVFQDGALPPIDCLLVSEAALLREGHYRLAANSLLLYGRDIRDQMHRHSLAEYLRTYTQAPLVYLSRVLRSADCLVYPLGYPDAGGEFFGYDSPMLPHEIPAHNVKAFVAATCWIASLSVGLRAGLMVPSRAASAEMYRRYVGDAWTDFIEKVYAYGKHEWSYRVPAESASRRLLRDLCRQMPDFENAYLAIYRAYLLREIDQGDPAAVRFALEQLGTLVLFPDDEVTGTVGLLTKSADSVIRAAASETLAALEKVRS